MLDPVLEIIATISGILCVFLQTRGKIIAWPFGIISVAISAFIFWESKLYSDFILHIVYIGLNIYGWINWAKNQKNNQITAASIRILRLVVWGIISLVILLFSGLVGRIMQVYTDASLPYFDAFTTVGSLLAQYLLAKKYLGNWIIWIVVDLVAINVYLVKGLYYFAFLFFIYLILCIIGYSQWKKKLA